jgi:3-methyladenine DNA glycosylase AlkD
MLSKIKKELRKYASVERKKTNEWFFKTGKGEYGEGDVFIGVRVPNLRKIAKQFSEVDLEILQKLLYSEIHEERLLALLILVEQNKQAVKQGDKKFQKKIVNFYLKHQDQVNNWDLVDLSAHYILGQAILDGIKKESLLDEMAVSKNLWTRRKAIIATWIIIRKENIKPTLRLSKKLLRDKEDLMHKAVGWMLREAWKLGEINKKQNFSQARFAKNKKGQKAQKQIERFLIKNYNKLPRTVLRYAIERMSGQKRKRFLKGMF